jgi:PHD/YefM family antitoxin component YafN of YafNO toxin-antitoxin module
VLPCATGAARVAWHRNDHAVPSFLTESTELVMTDPRAKLLAVLDYAEEYRSLALRAKDRRERECYERIVELYEEIAEELEALIDG